MDKKNRLRAGFSFGIGMTIFFLIQNLLLRDNQTTNQVVLSIVIAIAAGAISGVLFAWLIGLFANSKFVKRTTKIETAADENILFETPANHFKGMEGVGGKLYLTNKRLVFKSHNLNIQNHQLSVLLNDLKKINRYKTLGLVNNGLSITTNDDRIEKFVVEQVENWIKLLEGKQSLL
jgi:hypothetical protein